MIPALGCTKIEHAPFGKIEAAWLHFCFNRYKQLMTVGMILQTHKKTFNQCYWIGRQFFLTFLLSSPN